MKKLLSLILVFILCFSFVLPVSAAEEFPTGPNIDTYATTVAAENWVYVDSIGMYAPDASTSCVVIGNKNGMFEFIFVCGDIPYFTSDTSNLYIAKAIKYYKFSAGDISDTSIIVDVLKDGKNLPATISGSSYSSATNSAYHTKSLLIFSSRDLYLTGTSTIIYAKNSDDFFKTNIGSGGSAGDSGSGDSGNGSSGSTDNSEYQSGVIGWFQRLFDSIVNLGSSIGGFFDDLWNNLSSAFWAVIYTIEDVYYFLSDNLGNFFTTLGSTIGGFFTNLWNNLSSAFSSLTSAIGGFFTDFWNKISAFFTPDTAKMSEQFNSLYDKFGFVQIISTIVDDIGELFTSTPEPPTIKIDLSLNESNINLGSGKHTVIDLSWYGRYKPTVDIFFSMFLWIGFIWLLYRRLPDIISGAGMITESAVRISSSPKKGVKK